MVTQPIWKTDIQDWTRLNKDTVNFFLSQAESHLKYCLDVSDKITARAFTLLSVILPIITISISFLINQLDHPDKAHKLVSLVILGLFVVICCMAALVWLVFPRKAMYTGRDPKDIFTSSMVDNDLEKDLLYVAIVMNEIENIQCKIDYNDSNNLLRIRVLKAIIIAIFVTFSFSASALLYQFAS